MKNIFHDFAGEYKYIKVKRSYVELLLPHFAEGSQDERLTEKIDTTEAGADVMKDRHDAVVDERAVGLEILQGRSITIHDRLIAELSQVLVDVERALQDLQI